MTLSFQTLPIILLTVAIVYINTGFASHSKMLLHHVTTKTVRLWTSDHQQLD